MFTRCTALLALNILTFDAVSQALGLGKISAREMLKRFTADSRLISRDTFVVTIAGVSVTRVGFGCLAGMVSGS